MSVLLQEDAGYTSEIDLAHAAVCRRETFVFTVTEPDAPYMGLKSATVADGVLKLVVKGAEDYIAGDSVVIHVSGMTNYTDTTTEDSITFHTSGYGHGVGLWQYGAKYMAEQGSDYQEILSHYYQDAVLTNL